MDNADENFDPPRDDAAEPHFLDDERVQGVMEKLLDEFASETDRGAVLIAGEMVSAHLRRIIAALAPAGFTKKRLGELLKYPGPLANFSARADIAFLAGFISEPSYKAITALRGLRNAAAHSADAFDLVSRREELRKVCDLGPAMADFVTAKAAELLLQSVVASLLERGVELEAEIGTNLFASTAQILDELEKRPKQLEKLDERRPRMELAMGVWLLLGLMAAQEKALLAKRDARKSAAG